MQHHDLTKCNGRSEVNVDKLLSACRPHRDDRVLFGFLLDSYEAKLDDMVLQRLAEAIAWDTERPPRGAVSPWSTLLADLMVEINVG